MINVLNVIQSGETKPTRIMYGANLSWKICSEILDSLVSQELVETMDTSESIRKRDKRTSTEYKITSKGQNVIKYFNQAKGLINIKQSIPVYQMT